MGNNRAKKSQTSEPTTPIAPTAPVTPTVIPDLSNDAPGSLAPTGNGAIAPSGGGESGGNGQGSGRIEAANGLSEMTQRLFEKADALTRTINAKAQARFEASEEFLMGLVEGTVTTADLITRYGLTDDVTAQRELLELQQLGNSIKISIAQKDVQILALKDQRKTFEIAEEEAKTAGQIQDTADAIDNARHKQVMSAFKAQIRAHKERGKSAEVVIEGHKADKKETKRDGIFAAMQQTASKRQGGNGNGAATGDRQTANANN